MFLTYLKGFTVLVIATVMFIIILMLQFYCDDTVMMDQCRSSEESAACASHGPAWKVPTWLSEILPQAV